MRNSVVSQTDRVVAWSRTATEPPVAAGQIHLTFQ
jgi:hypothetical protein